jgi:hypothetical protein
MRRPLKKGVKRFSIRRSSSASDRRLFTLYSVIRSFAASSKRNRLIFAATGTPSAIAPSRRRSRSRATSLLSLYEDSSCPLAVAVVPNPPDSPSPTELAHSPTRLSFRSRLAARQKLDETNRRPPHPEAHPAPTEQQCSMRRQSRPQIRLCGAKPIAEPLQPSRRPLHRSGLSSRPACPMPQIPRAATVRTA